MKTILDNKDIDTLLHEGFCSGLTDLAYSEVIIDWSNKKNEANYKKAKKRATPSLGDYLCREDVLLEMLKGEGIIWDDNGEEVIMTYESAKEKLQKACEDAWFLGEVMKIIPVYTDADSWTAYHMLQGALFGEVIYG